MVKEDEETESEYRERLRLAFELTSDTLALQGSTIPAGLLGTLGIIKNILDVEQFTLEEVTGAISSEHNQDADKIIISCSAAITKNPDGMAAVGFVIRFPTEDRLAMVKRARRTSATNILEAEYDALYEALTALFSLHNRPKHEVVIRNDSNTVVRELTEEVQVLNSVLQRKRESIHEYSSTLPVPVKIEWHPRNSTTDLIEANFLAQDELNIRRC